MTSPALNRRQFLTGLAVAAAAPTLLSSRDADACERADEFEITETTLVIKGLHPAHHGLRVAQLTDFHVGVDAPDGRLVAAVRAVNAAKPDVVVLTGDFVTTSRDPVEHVPEVLKGLEMPAFAVLGNHDHWVDAPRVRRAVERMGYTVLQNESTVTRVRGAALGIVGVDDGRTKHDDVARAFAGAPASGTRLVLTHTPPTADKLPEGLGLPVFTGHTHGGQIHVPGLTETIFRVGGEPYLRGRYEVRGNHLYVSRGLGFGAGTRLPRVGSTPEVALFTLLCA